jgi:hypothetical protein
MNAIWCRALTPALLLAALLLPAHAQQPPSAPAQAAPQSSPYCSRLETQLTAFDRGSSDQARADQLQKLEQTEASQQAELDRQEANARRSGCERSSFFVLFNGQQATCGPINTKIQQMRDNLEKIQGDIEKSRGDVAPEREGQRRAILVALAQNNCGAQYQQQVAATPPPKNGLFDTLFGPKTVIPPGAPGAPDAVPGMSVPSGSYRTICVRTCDGFYYPISYAADPSRFANDDKTCRQSCPASDAQLYIYRSSGEDVNQAVSVAGQQPYTSLPNAFRYRTSVDKTCTCRQPGASWAQTMQNVDDNTVEQGDIIVNDQRARQLSQPRVDAQGKPIRQAPAPRAAQGQPPAAAQNQPAAPPAATTQAAPAAPDTATSATTPDATPVKPDPNRKVRTVGPTFIPAR